MGAVIFILWLAVVVLTIVSLWVTFSKAGQPGWAAIIPIYNAYVYLKIAGKPGWWLILLFIPIVNFVIWIIACVAFAAQFGKGGGFAVGMFFLPFIFYPILAFGDAKYASASAAPAPAAAN